MMRRRGDGRWHGLTTLIEGGEEEEEQEQEYQEGKEEQGKGQEQSKEKEEQGGSRGYPIHMRQYQHCRIST